MESLPQNPRFAEQFDSFEVLELIQWYDGPKIFTLLDATGGLCLALWFDEDEGSTRYFFVPFSESLLNRLKSGQLSLLESLDQPRLWLVDVNREFVPINAKRVTISDFSPDDLPVPGTLLSRELELANTTKTLAPAVLPSGGIPSLSEKM